MQEQNTLNLNELYADAKSVRDAIKQKVAHSRNPMIEVFHDHFEIALRTPPILADTGFEKLGDITAFSDAMLAIKDMCPDYFDVGFAINSIGEIVLYYRPNAFYAGNTMAQMVIESFTPEDIEIHVLRESVNRFQRHMRRRLTSTQVRVVNERTTASRKTQHLRVTEKTPAISVPFDCGARTSPYGRDYVVFSMNAVYAAENFDLGYNLSELIDLTRQGVISFLKTTDSTWMWARQDDDYRIAPLCYEIDWDLDEEDYVHANAGEPLPRFLERDNLETADDFVNRITEEYGYCVSGIQPVV